MEPITHFLTGACIGRAGFNRKTAFATAVALLAAEAADVDILWSFAGPVENLKHHRGITHTLVGAPVLAVVVVGVAWLVNWFWERRKLRRAGSSGLPPLRPDAVARMGHPVTSVAGGITTADPSTAVATRPSLRMTNPGGEGDTRTSNASEVRWGWLYLTALVAALSHILLDWTNNYGVRPFFPFNPRWYSGSIIFIAEPLWWALLVLALVMPWVLGLADREIGVKKQRFRGRGWAIFALAGMLAIGCWRWVEHEQALTMLRQTEVASAPVMRTALEPYPVNPYRWHAILETRDFYQTAEVNTWASSSPAAIESDPRQDVLFKPTDTPAVEAAKRTLLGQVYLDWGTWALVRDLGPVAIPAEKPPELPPGRDWTTVEFTDLRFMYSFMATRPRERAPLGGWVYIVDGSDEAGEGMGARPQPID